MEFIAKRVGMQLRLQNVTFARYIDTMDAMSFPIFVTCAEVMMLPATNGITRILPCATDTTAIPCDERVR
ncbi:MAG: hypothetical protein CMM73_04440 [Rhodospirillaceae bacterium]|nr:hypothetical protein [Rhodospirillaceae bacterium]|tara:strand:+ start:196 stop:405 length:210 start_codon:yes stop_codon:yes gene_type:complete